MNRDARLTQLLVVAVLAFGLVVLFAGCSSKTDDASSSVSTRAEADQTASTADQDEHPSGQTSEEGSDVLVHVTQANFDAEVLQSEIPVLVDFWAEWCAPCKRLAPIVEEVAAEMEGKLKVAKADTEQTRSQTSEYNITAIPDLLIFKDGEVVGRKRGYMSKEELVGFINSTLGGQ